jgi:hypothetical protein
MNDEFVRVMGSGVVQDIGDLSQAFALLSQKLDVTGDELVALTVDFSAFADVNRTSVAESVRLITDVMNQWNISVQDSVVLMDQLTRAAQLTGRPVTEISQAVLNSSAQFKQLGLSLTDSLGFLTAFSKVGADVNATTQALNHAVVVLAQSGGDVAEGFKDAISSIQTAKTSQEALTIATDLFGQRSAPKMVDALRNAKFDLAGFTEQMATAGGTVERTNEATETFGDKWAAFGNKAMAAVEPLGEVLVSIGKIVLDLGTKIFEVLNNILSPILNLIRDEFRDFGDTAQAIFGAVGAAIRGDWKTAWTEAQLIVLNVVKAVLDFFSAMANQIIGIINNMTSALRTTLDAVGVHIKAIAAVSLAELTGVSEAIKSLNDSIQKDGEKTTKVLGQQSVQRQAMFNEELHDYEIGIQERIKAALELQEAYETDLAGQRAMIALSAQAVAASNRQAQAFEQDAAIIGTAMQGLIDGPFTALGAAIVNQENLWKALASGALHAMGLVVKGLGDQMAAKAALDLAQAIAYSTNPFTAPAAPGYYAQAAIEGGAAAAAYTAAGALSAFEKGTPYSTGGAAMLGEAGPELVMGPSIHNLVQGSVVLDAAKTAKLMGGGKGTTLQFNIGSMSRESAGAVIRKVNSAARSLAFEGVL